MTFFRLPLFLVFVLCFGLGLAVVPGKTAWALPAAEQPANASPQQPAEPEPGDDAYRHSASEKTMAGWLHMGKEPAAQLFEYFNFAVLAAAVLYGLAKIVPKTFRTNRETIQNQLAEARTATQEANQRLAAIEQRLSHLGEEIASISKQAEKDTAEDEARIKATLKEEQRRISDAVGKEIAAASSAAQRELKRFAAGLAVDRATQTLSLTADDDHALLQEFSEKLAQHTHGRGES